MLKRAVWWSCPVWLSLASIAPAGIVFEQLPNLTSGQSADTDFITDSGLQFWQLLADNVALNESAVIRHVTWWGFYGGDFDESPGAHDPPVGPETMRIRLYATRNSDNFPDNSNVLFEDTVINPSRIDTGRTMLLPGIPSEYRFQTQLSRPMYLEAGLLYWFAISQVGDVSSHFRWGRGTGLINGFAFSNPIVPNWQGTPGSFAFQLSTIPEPASAALVGVVSLILLRRRRRRSSPC